MITIIQGDGSTYIIDAALHEDHEHGGEASKYPIEKGAQVTDHVKLDPIVVTLECIVSDTPLIDMLNARAAAGLIPPPLFPGDALPQHEAYARLKAIRAAREPVTIEDSLDAYEDMLLIDLSVPRESGEPGQLHFTASFQQALFVTNDRSTIRVAVPNASAGTNRGPKASKYQLEPTLKDRFGGAVVRRVFTKDELARGYRPYYQDAFGNRLPETEVAKSSQDAGATYVQYDKDGHATPVPFDGQDPNVGTPSHYNPWWAQDGLTHAPTNNDFGLGGGD